MSLRKIGYTLYKIAKQGDSKTFLRYIEQNKVLTNLQSLSPIDSSQLIYSFSVLKISDRKIWQGLEDLFLTKEKAMNLQDIVMCASAFSKSSQNVKIWRAIESYVIANESQIFEVRDIVMLFYSFANVKFTSPELWALLEKFSMVSPYRFNSKELTMLAWSFGRVKRGSPSFWNRLEQIVQPLLGGLSVQNQSIISYSFSRMKQGSPKFWDTMDKALRASISESKKVKTQDIVNIVWAFKNLNKGTPEFWEVIEKTAVRDIGKFTLLDLTNISYSFLTSKKEHMKFWKGFEDHLENNLAKIKDENHQEVVILSEILTKREIKDPKVWTLLAEHFTISMKKGLVNNSMFRARWHKRIYEMQPKIWDQEIEKIYLQSIDANLEKKPHVALKDLFNICFCAFPNFGQQSFWENLLDKFLVILDSPEVVVSSEETRSMTARIIYILIARFSELGEAGVTIMNGLDEKLDNLYRDEKRFLLMTQEKFTLLTQLKAFVLKRSVHLTLFWTQMKKHQGALCRHWNRNDIRPLIFAIIVKNKLFFNKPKYGEFEKRIQDCYKDFTEEQISELVNFLWNELLTHYPNYTVVLNELCKNSLTKDLDIKSYILGKEEAAKQKKPAEGGYSWLMDSSFDQDEAFYVEDDSEPGDHNNNLSD